MGVRYKNAEVETREQFKEVSLHRELTQLAVKWLKRHTANVTVPNCPYIAGEVVTTTITGETPDVIGWCYWTSVLIEVKVGRGDFLADAKKSFRKISKDGMGEFRYYCCPAGLIKETELPNKWGLLYLNEKNKIDIIKVAERQEANLICERTILLSMLRRTM